MYINGTVDAIRFYKHAGNTGTHVGNLWTGSGTLLSSVTFTGETSSGWQQASLSTPVLIQAGQTYVVSYHAPNGHYSVYDCFPGSSCLNSGRRFPFEPRSYDSGWLSTGSSGTFPTTAGGYKYYMVDIAFTQQFPNAIGETAYTATQAPNSVDSTDYSAVTVGMAFTTDVPGQVYGVRFMKSVANTGTHIGKLYAWSGVTLATVTFIDESAAGWQVAYFSSPVDISANTNYVVAYFAPNGGYSFTAGEYNAPTVSGHINRPIDAGLFSYGASPTFPSSTWNHNDYLVDVDFMPAKSVTASASINPEMTFTVSGHPNSGTCNGEDLSDDVTPTGTAVAFGSMTTSANKVAAQDLQTTSNNGSGITVYSRKTGLLTNGSDFIGDVAGTYASPGTFPSPGTAAFGYTTDESGMPSGTPDRFTNPTASWAYFTTSNSAISFTDEPADHTICVAYQVGVSTTTPAGTYSTTIIYTAVPNY